jgi:hypothetical protein
MSWLSKLQDVIADNADKIPPGWWTIESEAKRLKVAATTIRRNVRKAIKAEILERRNFKVMGKKYLVQIPFYKERK